MYICNFANQNNLLYNNNGDGTFTKASFGQINLGLGFSISNSWGDVDNDGDLDLFVSNGFANTGATNNFYYLNNGDGTFTKQTGLLTENNGWTYGSSFGDFNKDGYLDLAVANCLNNNELNSIYVNNGGSNNWLVIDLEGNVTNKSAIGSNVKIKANIFGSNILQNRRVAGQSAHCSQNLQLHFGLGDAAVIDTIIVEWLSGEKTILVDVSANQF